MGYNLISPIVLNICVCNSVNSLKISSRLLAYIFHTHDNSDIISS